MIVDFAARHRLPAVYQATMFADAGGLMAWAPDQEERADPAIVEGLISRMACGRGL